MKKERSLGESAPFFGGKQAVATCSNCSFSVRYKLQDTQIQDMKYPYGNSRSISCILYLCILYLFDQPKFETFFNRQSVGNERGHRRYGVPLVWPTRKDSNLRPSESESDALSSCATGRYGIRTLLLYHTRFEIASPFLKKCSTNHDISADLGFAFGSYK